MPTTAEDSFHSGERGADRGGYTTHTNGADKPSEEAPLDWTNLGLEVDGKGRPVINVDNILTALEHDPELNRIVWYDDFHNRIFTRLSRDLAPTDLYREWTDTDAIRLAVYMQGVLKLPKVTDELVGKAVKLYAELNRRNEPKEWMETLVWDKGPRIENFLANGLGVAHSMYARAVSKNFWIGLIARIYKPGCQLDNMVVLEGPQGIGKTRALRAIGGKWYAEASSSVQDKDFYLALQGKLLIEIGELESFSKADVTKIKGAITCLNDRFRTPYDKSSQDHPRQCVFAGTTNETKWVKDQTGARRFWPVKCDLIDIPYIEFNREQLFAEAIVRFKDGENWYEMPESTLQEQDERRMADAWEEPVAEWLAVQLQGMSLSTVAREALSINLENFHLPDQKRVAQCMRRAGWEVKHTEFGNLWYKVNQPTKTEPIEPKDENKPQP